MVSRSIVCGGARLHPGASFSAVHPTVTLPAITGSQGSLNLFVALVGAPGTGKSTSNRIAAELLPITSSSIRDDLPLGSGSGRARVPARRESIGLKYFRRES